MRLLTSFRFWHSSFSSGQLDPDLVRATKGWILDNGIQQVDELVQYLLDRRIPE